METGEFNRLYNELEQLLKNHYDLDKTIQMSYALNRAKQDRKNNPIKNNWETISIIKDLRNIIIHGTNIKIEEVAHPSEHLILILKKIINYYKNPKSIRKFLIEQKNYGVKSFQVNDNLKSVLEFVNRFKYSQFPLFDSENFLGMISDNGITNWLANSLDADSTILENLEDVLLSEIFKFEETQSNVCKIYKEDNIFNLIDIFSKEEVDVVLICEKKNCDIKKTTDIFGIITIFDLKELYKELK
ncbi:CBS domain-containing protein [Streptococcus marimammalium]|uniref:CBS domain-containing protein n=1 Tax=Streptococcus marimammalium TaxID=269666 RepID=UPI00036A5802|nr:CBS domain-containing protein [Streptococcus marimammalium]